MFNISQQKIDFNCPECGLKNKVTLEQIEKQIIIKCSDCNKDITLIDKDGSAKRSVADINKAVKDLENTIKKFGR